MMEPTEHQEAVVEPPVVTESQQPQIDTKLIDNTEDAIPENPDDEFHLEFYRWVLLAKFCLLSFTNAWIWVTFAPISTLAIQYYGTSFTMINILSVSYMMVYIPGSPLGSFIVGKYGLRAGLWLGCGLNFLGAFLRLGGIWNNMFVMMMMGTFICAAGQVFILGVPPRLAAQWFSSKERTWATTIGAMFNQLGIGFGFLTSPMFVNQYGSTVSGFTGIFISQAIYAFLAMFFLIFMKEKPDSPPSASEFVALKIPTQTFFRDIVKPMINKDFIVLFISFGISTGSFYAISTLLDQIVSEKGYSSYMSGLFGFLVVAGGIVGGFLVGYVQIIWWKMVLKGFLVLLAATLILTVIFLIPDMAVLLSILFIFFGAFGTALLPIVMELGCETTHPLDAAVSSNTLLTAPQIFGIIFTMSMSEIWRAGVVFWGNNLALWLLLIFLVGGALLIQLYTSRLKRYEAEEKKEAKNPLWTYGKTLIANLKEYIKKRREGPPQLSAQLQGVGSQ